MLVMTSFYSVQVTEIFKKQNKTKVTRFVQDISLVWAGPGHEESHQSVDFFSELGSFMVGSHISLCF